MIRRLSILAIFIALSIFPGFLSSYIVVVLLLMFMFITLAVSYDIIGGYLGYLNLGHSTFFGLGAYGCGILLNHGISLPAALVLSTLFTLVFAIAISYPFFRIKGAYFALATFGLITLFYLLAHNLRELTGGAGGLSTPPGNHLIPAYYLAFGLAILTIAANYLIARSKFGLALISIREDELVAESFGISIFRTKAIAFAISSVFPSLIGGIYVWYATYISPSSVFGLEIALVPIIMAMLGGSGTLIGPIIGSIFITTIQEIIWVKLPYLHLTIYGSMLIIVGLFMPGGLVRTKVARKLLTMISKDR